jgi:hypothetical protein
MSACSVHGNENKMQAYFDFPKNALKYCLVCHSTEFNQLQRKNNNYDDYGVRRRVCSSTNTKSTLVYRGRGM